MKYITEQSKQQITLFPVSLDDAVEAENEVRLIDVVVESLNLDEFGFKTDFIENGRPAYHFNANDSKIVEHPYGTLKCQWRFNYIITKNTSNGPKPTLVL